MDSLEAFRRGEANRHKELMVFDWDKAAHLIKKHGVKNASAGLSRDWMWTGGEIFTDGKPNKDDYTFLASTWATPELKIGEEIIDCYVLESETDWDEKTKWPQSALTILKV